MPENNEKKTTFLQTRAISKLHARAAGAQHAISGKHEIEILIFPA